MVTEKDAQSSNRSAKTPQLVRLPCELETWPLIQGALAKLKQVSRTADLIAILDHVQDLMLRSNDGVLSQRRSVRSMYAGLVNFLDHVASKERRGLFFRQTLPMLVEVALAVKELRPKNGFYYSVQQRGGETQLSRHFVASLLAHMFFCTLPEASNQALNLRHFKTFFAELEKSKQEDSQTAKLRCILHYFDRIATEYRSHGPPGNLTFIRKVIPRSELPVLESWEDSRLQLCPLVVRSEGLIEEAGSGTLQVDFANKYIGGSVLGWGSVQEEIRFSVCPELLVSLAFMESMEDNEAIVISGFEQFAKYKGYARSLRFAGNHRDNAQISSAGDIKTSLIAIDATNMADLDNVSTPHYQYTGPALVRELNKALVGFQQQAGQPANGGAEDQSESIYLDAIDHSQISNEADFETASEGLDSLSRHAPSSLPAILDYSNSLSRAITDIAVKDYCQSRNYFAQRAPSTDSQRRVGDGDHAVRGCNQSLDTYASAVAGEVVKDGFTYASKNSTPSSTCGTKGSLSVIDGVARGVVESSVQSAFNRHIRGPAEDKQERIGSRGAFHQTEESKQYQSGDANGISQTLSAIIDDIVSVVIREAIGEIAGSYVSETESTRVPSLEGYSVISTWSSKSDSFVRIDIDSDFSGTRSAGSLSSAGSDKAGMSVETYVSGVVAGAVHKMKGDTSPDDAPPRTQSEASVEAYVSGIVTGAVQKVKGDEVTPKPQREIVKKEMDPHDKLANKIVNGSLMEMKMKSGQGCENSFFKPVVSAGLDSFASSIAGTVYKEALGEVTSSTYAYPLSQYATIPSTPPPSPSNASTGSSKRFSLEDPCQLEEFAEKLLSSITPDPTSEKQEYCADYDGHSGMNRLQEIEDFASNLVSRVVSDSTHQVCSGQPRRESSSGCISSRSSLTVPSGSSKRSSVDSFTEDLLRIGNIDPTGRRPSKTEENIAFFSQELTRVNEVDEKLSQRRKSDLEEFQQELFQSSISSSAPQKHKVTQSRIHAASRLANRLSDDIICDAFLQLYGATPFRELIRLDSLSDLDSGAGSRRRSYPRRGNRTSSVSSASLSVRSTISEMDLVTLATNLANTIIESALQTYRAEYLASQRSAVVQTTGDDDDSQMQDTLDDASILATYDGSNMDQQEIANSIMEEPPELSIQDTAGCIVERAVQDAVSLYHASMTSSAEDARYHVSLNPKRPIATGNWGCGAFGGDPQLKSLIQWLAASQCRAPSVFYYSFNDTRVHQLEQVTLKIQTMRWSVGDVMRIILEYCHLVTTSGEDQGLFDYILGLQSL